VSDLGRIVPDDDEGRGRAVAILQQGGVVALPTDTVYGIAVALETPGGIERLFALKRRPPEKGIALLLADADQARELARWGRAAEALGGAFWPGALTLVAPIAAGVDLPAALTGGAATVGVRVPAHDAPRALARAIGPLPTTSANRSGEPEAPDAHAVLDQLGDGLDLVLDGGPAHGATASTVVLVDGDASRVLRIGAIEPGRIGEVLRAADLPAPTAS
jgi:L-threonylcarbamoyladenylate synthase